MQSSVEDTPPHRVSGLWAVIWVVVAAVIAAALAATAIKLAGMAGLVENSLFMDPAAHYNLPFYAGFFSNVGIALTTATAAVTAMTALLAPRVRMICVIVAVFSIVLAGDDLLLAHEYLGPDHLGIEQVYFFVAYAIIGLAIFGLVLRQEPSQAVALILVGFFLATSIFIDVLKEFGLDPWFRKTIYEDSAKFMGLVAWFVFWLQFSVQHLRATQR